MSEAVHTMDHRSESSADEITSPLESPLESPAASPLEAPQQSSPRLPTMRSMTDGPTVPTMNATSSPLGVLNSARKPAASTMAHGGMPQSMQEKMKAFHLSRQGTPPGGRPQASQSASYKEAPQPPAPHNLAGALRLPPNMRPQPGQGFASAPVVPRMGAKPSLSARRNMPKLGSLPGAPAPAGPPSGGLSLSQINGDANANADADAAKPAAEPVSAFSRFSQYVDTKNGRLNFAGKATIHGSGIDFSSGSNFSISLDEVDTLEELGKGNYGTVYKVRHARPRHMRRPGLGLAKQSSASQGSLQSNGGVAEPAKGTTGVVMAMKEIRLELDEAKFAAIIMELDILHRCVSPYIIDFYGAFFQEGAVYICIEFMDGGSIDKLYGDGMPENVLRKIAYATTRGLKELKDVHNIIHRDVKPTNILVNTRGQVKICDFGVSGNLVASIAKTNIGCQSYMAPERISGGGVSQAGANPGGGTYSVQSDIWSLGLTIIECAMGRYPYPPETYNNIFSQLSVSESDTRAIEFPANKFSRLSLMASHQICQPRVTPPLPVTSSKAASTKSQKCDQPTPCSSTTHGCSRFPNHRLFQSMTKTRPRLLQTWSI